MSTTAEAIFEEEFLSRRQRRTTIPLPPDPDDEELARNWTLSEADKNAALRCRGEAQRRRARCHLHAEPRHRSLRGSLLPSIQNA